MQNFLEKSNIKKRKATAVSILLLVMGFTQLLPVVHFIHTHEVDHHDTGHHESLEVHFHHHDHFEDAHHCAMDEHVVCDFNFIKTTIGATHKFSYSDHCCNLYGFYNPNGFTKTNWKCLKHKPPGSHFSKLIHPRGPPTTFIS